MTDYFVGCSSIFREQHAMVPRICVNILNLKSNLKNQLCLGIFEYIQRTSGKQGLTFNTDDPQAYGSKALQ